MNDSHTGVNVPAVAGSPEDRLDSWKKIASHLRRDVRTVQRWEQSEGMPVHRHLHHRGGSVYAFRSELNAWWQSRRVRLESGDTGAHQEQAESSDRHAAADTARLLTFQRLALIGLAAVLLAGSFLWWALRSDYFWHDPLANARFTRLPDLGTEHSAAISRDGKLVAIVAERDGQNDAWISEGNFDTYRNLTRGALQGLNLVNREIRSLAFSVDGSVLAVWTRRSDGSQTTDVSLLGIPTGGGPPGPYAAGAAEFDWSHDGKRLVYHTTAPGDPLLIREPAAASQSADRRVYVAPAGVHCHFPLWSTDDSYIYFVRGVPGGKWDIWRIRPAGTGLEQITKQGVGMTYPVMIDARTLLYLATDQSGGGPWMYAVDVERRRPHRVSSGLETYASLAASADGSHLVATITNPHSSLWRLSLADHSGAEPGNLALLTANGASPRFGTDSILYVSSASEQQGIWSLSGAAARKLWANQQSRLVGRPSLAPDGRRIAFTVAERDQTRLYVMDADGTHARVVSAGLELRGGPVWSPDGNSLVSAVLREGEPRLMRIPLNGEPGAVLVAEYSTDPTWSPDGKFLIYFGADVGTSFPVRAAAADGRAYPLPSLMLPRGSRVAFARDPQQIVVLRVEPGHMTLVQVDLASGAARVLRELPPGFVARDFDISPAGTQVVLDRVEENADVALIERTP